MLLSGRECRFLMSVYGKTIIQPPRSATFFFLMLVGKMKNAQNSGKALGPRKPPAPKFRLETARRP
jgi:hypothetical protein